MSTGAQLEEVQAVDGQELDTRKIAESLTNAMIFIVDDEGSFTHHGSAVTHFTLESHRHWSMKNSTCFDMFRIPHTHTHTYTLIPHTHTHTYHTHKHT